MSFNSSSYSVKMKTLDELLERDKRREEDGFPRKIKIGKILRPSKQGKNKVVIVPTTTEEKFIHDTRQPEPEQEEKSSGSGEGKEGEVIGEQPIHQPGGSGSGQGEGEGEGHDIISSAYDLGKMLTEKFQLPNLQDKGKKRSLTRYTYDLTDRNRGTGQILDKKSTLSRIIKTNIALGRIEAGKTIETTELLMDPRDKVYRTLSREQDYESQALVFFVRDYSSSMTGKPTEIVVSQHLLIYSWLMYQYHEQVETRFILHDTEAREVEDFNAYYNSTVAGGTRVAAAYNLADDIVQNESLAQDYNIYLFYGTDGEDWDESGEETVKFIKKIITYASRIGITVVRPTYASSSSAVESYIKKSGLLKEQGKFVRMVTLQEDASEERIIEGIKEIISP